MTSPVILFCLGARVSDLESFVVRACEILCGDEGFVSDGSPIGGQLVSLAKSFVGDVEAMVPVLVEHCDALESDVASLIAVCLGLVDAVKSVCEGGDGFDVDVWREELGEPALEAWSEFRGV